MKINLKNKVAIVTGGGTGIGHYIVQALDQAGATVVFTSRKRSSIKETLKKLNKNKKHMGIKIDLSKKGSVKKFHKLFKTKFKYADILINNIGHTLNVKNPFARIEDWEKVMRLNFFTSVEMVNHFIHDMKKRNWGRIINITSVAGMEISGPSSFNSSKAALTAYTKSVGRSLALEKLNVVMTAVAPGVIKTKKGHWNERNKNSKHAINYLKNSYMKQR